MGKVVGIHEVMLKDGVTEKEFEAVIAELKTSLTPMPPGLNIRIMKGVRGDRLGRYIQIFEFDSQEAYGHHVPSATARSEEVRQWARANAAALDKLRSAIGQSIFTDYAEV